MRKDAYLSLYSCTLYRRHGHYSSSCACYQIIDKTLLEFIHLPLKRQKSSRIRFNRFFDRIAFLTIPFQSLNSSHIAVDDPNLDAHKIYRNTVLQPPLSPSLTSIQYIGLQKETLFWAPFSTQYPKLVLRKSICKLCATKSQKVLFGWHFQLKKILKSQQITI